VAHCLDPDVVPRANQGLRGASHCGEEVQKRDHAHLKAMSPREVYHYLPRD
jgi:hypothetical protein